MRLVGLALVFYNLYVNARDEATGTGTPDDPIRLTTHSPLLALIGFVLITVGDD